MDSVPDTLTVMLQKSQTLPSFTGTVESMLMPESIVRVNCDGDNNDKYDNHVDICSDDDDDG